MMHAYVTDCELSFADKMSLQALHFYIENAAMAKDVQDTEVGPWTFIHHIDVGICTRQAWPTWKV